MGSCYVEFVGILGAFIHFYAVLSGLCLLRTIQFLSGTNNPLEAACCRSLCSSCA